MPRFFLYSAFFTVLFFCTVNACYTQNTFTLTDGRQHRYCEGCNTLLTQMPKEVLFGIDIHQNGDIYFSMNDKNWFNKIFKNNSYGVTVDLVSKDQYSCNRNNSTASRLPKGVFIPPTYRPDLAAGIDGLGEGSVYVKIGKVPPALKNKELEGNLAVVNGTYICFYTNFVNIDRSAWALLPMGLFTDSLLKINEPLNGDSSLFIYSKKVQVQMPFAKASAVFSKADLKKTFDSLKISFFNIRKIDIRAYSSVEGSEKVNNSLMKQRADAMVQALLQYQPSLQNIHILTAENWLDFYKDIENSAFDYLRDFSKNTVKQKLTDTSLLLKIEPLLANERKVIATLYIEDKSPAAVINDSSLLQNFDQAVADRNIEKARLIQKEIAERIIDKRIPLEFIHKLEVPQTKDFSPLLNDREVYKYLLRATTEWEALENFLQLRQLDLENGRINYNICALRFFSWQYGGDTTAPKLLAKEIKQLSKQGIDSNLVKRMLINYNILSCEDYMRVFNYDAKDASLQSIYTIYETTRLSDEEIYSMAKYFSFYAHQNWAEEIIEPRTDKIDVSEDLIFYYLNLLLFKPYEYDSDAFTKACINAIALNRKRFCNFFLPNDRGGASMQLLDYETVKELYCNECSKK